MLKYLRTLPLALIYLVTPLGYAANTWQGSLSDQDFQAFLTDISVNPGAITERPELLKTISTDQIAQAMEAINVTNFTFQYPVVIKGSEMPELLGKQSSSLSLMAVKGGKLIAIPFQIDEFDETGLTYIPKVSPYPSDGVFGEINIDDELVFMFRDAGLEVYNPFKHGKTQGTVIKELEFNNEGLQPRFAYLMENNPARSTVNYVNTDLDRGVIESTLFKIQYNNNNLLDIASVTPKAGPHYGKTILDNFYIEVSTGIFNEHVRVGLNSRDNIRVIPVGVKDGPIRSSVLLKIRINYAGIPVFKDYLNINVYEQAVNVPSRFTMDSMHASKLLLLFLKKPRAYVAADFHNMEGASLTFDSVNEMGAYSHVDGKMDAMELAINEARLPGDWLWFNSNQGWNLFLSLTDPIVEKGIVDHFLEGMQFHILYEDDPSSTTPYERFPGASPRIGVTVEGLPHIALDLLSATGNIDFEAVDNIGQLIDVLIDADKDGDLKKLDKIEQKVYDQMRKEGYFSTSQEWADLYMQDLEKIQLKGLPRETVNGLLRSALTNVKDIRNITTGEILRNLKAEARRQNVDLHDLEYAVQDTTLWFPLAGQTPLEIQQQTQNPPTVTAKDFVHSNVATLNE